MTDLEIIRLCAEAMGYTDVRRKGDEVHGPFGEYVKGIYWPLEDDAQAMALVKKFYLRITIYIGQQWGWIVSTSKIAPAVSCENADLNRAICKCVAKMQAAK